MSQTEPTQPAASGALIDISQHPDEGLWCPALNSTPPTDKGASFTAMTSH